MEKNDRKCARRGPVFRIDMGQYFDHLKVKREEKMEAEFVGSFSRVRKTRLALLDMAEQDQAAS